MNNNNFNHKAEDNYLDSFLYEMTSTSVTSYLSSRHSGLAVTLVLVIFYGMVLMFW